MVIFYSDHNMAHFFIISAEFSNSPHLYKWTKKYRDWFQYGLWLPASCHSPSIWRAIPYTSINKLCKKQKRYETVGSLKMYRDSNVKMLGTSLHLLYIYFFQIFLLSGEERSKEERNTGKCIESIVRVCLYLQKCTDQSTVVVQPWISKMKS